MDRDQIAVDLIIAVIGRRPLEDEKDADLVVAQCFRFADKITSHLKPVPAGFPQAPTAGATQVAYKDLAVGERYTLPPDLSDPAGVWVKLTDYRCVCVSGMPQGDKAPRSVLLGSTHPDTMVTPLKRAQT